MGLILLCVLSTLAFCLTARFLVKALYLTPAPRWALPRSQARFSSAARRIGRAYSVFALGALMALAAAGSVLSFVELFTVGLG